VKASHVKSFARVRQVAVVFLEDLVEPGEVEVDVLL
jgi:hypothetical protein